LSLLCLEIKGVFHNFDFSYGEEVKRYIDALITAVSNLNVYIEPFISQTFSEFDLDKKNLWINTIYENCKEIKGSMVKITDALKDINHR
ncbi:hypothetical protein LCGC14_3161650, partial [marine sediment metagenome]